MSVTRERIRREAAEADQALEQLRANPQLLDPANAEPLVEIPPAPAPAPNDPPAPALASIEQQLAELDQKYRSLQGNFSTVNANLQAATENNTRLMRLLEAREQAYNAPPAPSATPAPSAGVAISEEERTEMGPEFVAFMEKVVKAGVSAALAPVEARLTQLEGSLGRVDQQASYAANTLAKSEEEKFYEALQAAVPQFEAINSDPQFLTWLAAKDTFSGEVRKRLLERAAGELNAERAIAFFKAFLRETGRENPAPSGAEARPTVDLATLVTPNPVGGAPDPNEAPSDQRIWTQAEVDKVYDDRMRGRIDEATFRAKDREIMLALQGGRIR